MDRTRSAPLSQIPRGRTIYIDQSRAPLIRVTLEGVISDFDFTAYIAEADQVLAAGRHGLVFDGIRPFEFSPRHRKVQADWIMHNTVALARNCVGAAFAIDSVSARGTLTAILWLAKLPFEYITVKSVHEANAWVVQRLRQSETCPV